MRHTLAIVVALASCVPDVPATPSFQQDVMPVLAANCVRCHGTEPLSGPREMRLDAYADLVIRQASLPSDDPLCMASEQDPRCFDDVKLGAATYAGLIASRVADSDRPMPPRFGLDDYQIELLERWVSAGAPRGAPRPNNRPPDALLGEVTAEHVDVTVGDPDRDLVGGALVIDVAGEARVLGAISSGRTRIRVDTAELAPGNYPLQAQLDDGADLVTISLGSFTVEAP